MSILFAPGDDHLDESLLLLRPQARARRVYDEAKHPRGRAGKWIPKVGDAVVAAHPHHGRVEGRVTAIGPKSVTVASPKGEVTLHPREVRRPDSAAVARIANAERRAKPGAKESDAEFRARMQRSAESPRRVKMRERTALANKPLHQYTDEEIQKDRARVVASHAEHVASGDTGKAAAYATRLRQLDAQIELRKKAKKPGSKMSRRSGHDLLTESAVTFNPTLHPRGRTGEFVDVLGKLRVHGTRMQIDVTDRPPGAMEFQKGDQVRLPDGRLGTVLGKSRGGTSTFGGKHDTGQEPEYTVHTERPKAGSKAYNEEQVYHDGKHIQRQTAVRNIRAEQLARHPNYPDVAEREVEKFLSGYAHRTEGTGTEYVKHSKLTYAEQEMADREQRAREIAAKAEKGGASRAAFRPVQNPVTLSAHLVPDEWQVEHGYAEWGTSHRPIFAPGGRTRVGHEEHRFARMKPGTNVERMVFHFLAGKEAPPNPAPGSAKFEQFSYGMKGVKGATKRPGNAGERGALIRKITQAVAAWADGDSEEYGRLLEEACTLRAVGGPLDEEEADEVAEAFEVVESVVVDSHRLPWDTRLHPRGRGGRFRDVLTHLHMNGHHNLGRGISVQKGMIGTKVTTPHGTKSYLDEERAVKHAVDSFTDDVRRTEGKNFLARYSPGEHSYEHLSDTSPERLAKERTDRALARRRSARTAVTGEPSQRSKAQALVDSGLADDLADARAQLADMGEGGGRYSPGGSSFSDHRVGSIVSAHLEDVPSPGQHENLRVVGNHPDYTITVERPNGDRHRIPANWARMTTSARQADLGIYGRFGMDERRAVHSALQRQEIDRIKAGPVGLPDAQGAYTNRRTGGQVSAANGRASRRFANIERDVTSGDKPLHQALIDHGLAKDMGEVHSVLKGTRAADFLPRTDFVRDPGEDASDLFNRGMASPGEKRPRNTSKIENMRGDSIRFGGIEVRREDGGTFSVHLRGDVVGSGLTAEEAAAYVSQHFAGQQIERQASRVRV